MIISLLSCEDTGDNFYVYSILISVLID